MRFVFTKHARGKFVKFAKNGIIVYEKDVLKTIGNPEHLDKESDFPKMIASRPRDNKHILRVVFKIEDDIIIIITFYPARKGRYYEA